MARRTRPKPHLLGTRTLYSRVEEWREYFSARSSHESAVRESFEPHHVINDGIGIIDERTMSAFVTGLPPRTYDLKEAIEDAGFPVDQMMEAGTSSLNVSLDQSLDESVSQSASLAQ